MKSYTLPLSDPRADLETVGGKGMSLAKLAKAGMPVPGGFHVTTEAYREFVVANNLQAGINEALKHVDTAQPSTLETASEAISRLFAQADIPGDLANAIVNAYADLQPPKICRMHPSQANRRLISTSPARTRCLKPQKSAGLPYGPRALSVIVPVRTLAPRA